MWPFGPVAGRRLASSPCLLTRAKTAGDSGLAVPPVFATPDEATAETGGGACTGAGVAATGSGVAGSGVLCRAALRHSWGRAWACPRG